MKKLTQEQFISKANLVHNNYYDYSKTQYINSRSNIKIICPIHGEYEMKAMKHLIGQKCKKCAFKNISKIHSLGKDVFMQKANNIHNNNYDYSVVEYVNNAFPVKIKCLEHGLFEQIPKVHLRGNGCPKCSKEKRGWNLNAWLKKYPNSQISLYIIKCFSTDEVFYKFGITGRTLKNRFSYRLPYKYKIVRLVTSDVETIYYKEKCLRKLLKSKKYEPFKKFSGDTECFKL